MENIDKKANVVSSGGSTSGSGKENIGVMKGEEYEYEPPALLAFGQLVCSPLGRPSTPPSSLECLRFSGKGTNAILLILLGGRTVTVALVSSLHLQVRPTVSTLPSGGISQSSFLALGTSRTAAEAHASDVLLYHINRPRSHGHGPSGQVASAPEMV